MRKTLSGCLTFIVLVIAGMAYLMFGRKNVDLGKSLPTARTGFVTDLVVRQKNTDPVPDPPTGYRLVHYMTSLGSFPAYITVPPTPTKRYPAIIWLAGGFSNSIGDTPWAPATPDNDQSASAFSRAGIVTMYPSLRGGNNNPGYIEDDYGEVDDALAAERYVATLPFVDPHRIYLGGHSTGGTLAMLAAESAGSFRAVFAFGPMSSFSLYDHRDLTFNQHNLRENTLRSPIFFMNAITSPTFVFEGQLKPGNLWPLERMSTRCHNPRVLFFEVPGETHFSDLAPVTPVIAREILADTGPAPNFSFVSAQPQVVAAPR
jgi:pimeloyl-ACP methyl ester carboxylesterase